MIHQPWRRHPRTELLVSYWQPHTSRRMMTFLYQPLVYKQQLPLHNKPYRPTGPAIHWYHRQTNESWFDWLESLDPSHLCKGLYKHQKLSRHVLRQCELLIHMDSQWTSLHYHQIQQWYYPPLPQTALPHYELAWSVSVRYCISIPVLQRLSFVPE